LKVTYRPAAAEGAATANRAQVNRLWRMARERERRHEGGYGKPIEQLTREWTS
jgi:hypothetical protein